MTDTTEVQRFQVWDMSSDSDDEWVRATDYDALAAKLAEVEAERDQCDAALTETDDARAGWGEAHEKERARAEAAEAALVAVYRLAWEDAYQEHPFDAGAIPTAADLLARIKETSHD